MAAVDGWVKDVEDVLTRAEEVYRQITPDTFPEEKRSLLGESKKLVLFSISFS